MHFLQGRMDVPKGFGWFHFLWIGLVILACVFIYIFRGKISRKGVNIALLSFGLVLIVFEIYKQLVFSFNYNAGGGTSSWHFQWYAFPFQFCSTPMYLMIFAGILRKGKVYDCILSYLSTFSLFGGITVMVYTEQVLTSMIGINIQTMFWHSGLVVIAFLLLATKSVKFKWTTVLKASYVFLVMLALALIMNVIWHFCSNLNDTFNMFYISPYFPCSLIILDQIYLKVPYVVFLMTYVIGFVLIAFIIMSIAIGFDKLFEFIRQKRLSQEERDIQKIFEIVKSDL